MWQDLRFGMRLLLKQPGVTAVIVIVLALGIGANTALFSVVNAVLLRPLPFPSPDRLVLVWESKPKQGDFHATVAPANYIDWKEQNRVFDGIAATLSENATLTGNGEPERIPLLYVTGGFFSLLGTSPFKGRTLTLDDDRPGANGAAVISYGLRQRRFGGVDSILGQNITLEDEPCMVVGVMPPDFKYLGRADELWLPLRMTSQAAANRGGHYLRAVARLKPDVTLQQARADLDAIMVRLQQQFPNDNKDRGAYLSPLREEMVGNIKPMLLTLFGASGFVLLIACVNVANLMLVRAAGRQKELAVRTAIGAGRWRLLRQFIAESIPLSVMGGAAGLLLAYWGLLLLKSSLPSNISQLGEIRLDLSVLSFTLVVSLLTGLLFGLAPALSFAKVSLNEMLKEGGRRGFGGRQTRLHGFLVISEIALALILLVGAGLMIRSFARLSKVDPGFKADHLLFTDLSLPDTRYGEQAKLEAFFGEIRSRIEALPGVQFVGVTRNLPLTGGPTMTFTIDAQPALKEINPITGGVRGEYFRAMGIPLLKGRNFNGQDTPTSEGVVIISETFARQSWPGEDPVGKRMRMGPKYITSPWLTVVGLVGDVRQLWLGAPPLPQAYLSATQTDDFAARVLVVRTSVDPWSMTAAVRREIQTVEKDLPITLKTMKQVVSGSVGQNRFNMLLVGLFSLVALLLAAVGIYGVLSHSVAQHTHEIGIRMALGAQPRDVLKLVMQQGMVLLLVGIALGLAGALALSRVLTKLLYEVSTTDPLTFFSIPLLLALSAALACWLPARRATKVDPLVALRNE